MTTTRKRGPAGRSHVLMSALVALVVLFGGGMQVVAQDGTPTPAEETSPTPNDEAQPPPSNVGTDIPITYQGPPPSGFKKELVGPVELLRAAEVDLETFTFTLPLYRGEMADGTAVWYILTDTTDEGNANALGLNHSPKLAYANVEGAVRTATLEKDLTLTFDQGSVDFAPERVIVAGPEEAPFPPAVAEPGSVGDAQYSPLVRIENAGGHIYNAPILAMGVEAEELQGFCKGAPDLSMVHDRVVSICPDRALVTLKAVAGFSFARPVVYVSFEASDPMAATMEQSTFAPALANVQVGFDDGAFSAVERLFSFANGPTGVGNPQRQGFDSVLSGESTEPLNVFGGVPTIALDYSPLWDMNLGVWTDEAIEKGYRSRLIDEFQILDIADQGFLTGPDGADYGSSGIIINCPIVMRLL
ncbi:MAG: hypothetical protein AVDCRST_MAG59-3647 [uncultured Thermomicrobiales bacterium]|uniref:Uncharacterized protein n=1 Tax=uncultured Thermomicrobiales bacterium TaxID=1645740 RepID=A0A6J4VD05_9BACT|nr:MAG: hypothetical protein AVDCRST_MAG59-3647 [uncultured Thermomicrobiales bacterium]